MYSEEEVFGMHVLLAGQNLADLYPGDTNANDAENMAAAMHLEP